MGGLPLGRFVMQTLCPYRKGLTSHMAKDYCTDMKRGLIKSFREYLNAKHRMNLANWRNNQFRQVSREYGDYLYNQDREMFNVCLDDALNGKGDYADWQHWGGK